MTGFDVAGEAGTNKSVVARSRDSDRKLTQRSVDREERHCQRSLYCDLYNYTVHFALPAE